MTVKVECELFLEFLKYLISVLKILGYIHFSSFDKRNFASAVEVQNEILISNDWLLFRSTIFHFTWIGAKYGSKEICDGM